VRGASLAATRGIPEATTLSAERDPAVRRNRRAHRRLGILALLWVVAVLVALFGALPTVGQSPDSTPAPTPAGETTPAPGATPAPTGSPSPTESAPPCPITQPIPTYPPEDPRAGQPVPQPLCPAQLSGNPADLLAWLFNPIFQTLFLGLAAFYKLIGDIGIAIILLTLAIKTLLIPLFRAQIVSQRRMQLLQPEIRAIQQKFKGNRAKVGEETMRLYRERNINPASGCLPAILQLFLLIPIYSVITVGLAAPDISSGLQFLGQPVFDIECQAPGTLEPCINPTISWLGGLDAHRPEVLFSVFGFGVSALALLAAFLQLIQTRMMTPPTSDPQARAQQRIFLILPLFSIIYGSFLPAGLFLYWIVFTVFSIVQQYLIVGWGSLFPLFGWEPGFAKNHQPRYPVSIEPVKKTEGGESRTTTDTSRSPSDRAAGTIRPARQRGRTSRRGRRR
jgi:YidC/Oxa1 family membrane protein insertase